MQVSLAEFWSVMGPLARGVVLVLAGMSLLSLTVAIEKWLSLRRTAKESARFLSAWRDALARAGYAAAAELAEQYPHSHSGHAIACGTRVVQDTFDPATSIVANGRTVRRR